MPPPLRIQAVVERHAPARPRYVVVPASSIAGWGLAGTTTVDGTFGGAPLGRRSLKRWDDGRWFVELRADWCRRARISTGDRAELVLEVASERLPEEIVELLARSSAAKRCWERMTASQRRILREEVYAARRPETRARRARKALLPE